MRLFSLSSLTNLHRLLTASHLAGFHHRFALWKFWLVGFSSLRGPLEIWLVGFASLRGPLEIWLVGFASLRGPLEILDCRFTAAEFLPLNWPSQVI